MDSTSWNILLVDDEPDIHAVTELALKRRVWRNRQFKLTTASSGEQAAAILKENPPDTFQCAIVDVVMETPTAGLDLCKLIRQICPPSLRIVLRTGQPGKAPEELVLNEYDIDYYLAKPEVTSEKLYAVVRACLRSSQDVATLIAFSRQLRNFTEALRNVATLQDLLLFMDEGLKFLELKYGADIQFAHHVGEAGPPSPTQDDQRRATPEVIAALTTVHSQPRERMGLVPGAPLGLEPATYLLPFIDTGGGSDEEPLFGGLATTFRKGAISEKSLTDFATDAAFFIENWVIAYGTLRLQERVAQERLLRERMYVERMESIATMVAGVAHEINTPLGVANTANSMILSIGRRMVESPESVSELGEDLNEACDLMTRNLVRAHQLVRSFKQLSASQLSDHRATMDLSEVVKDCVSSLIPELRKNKLEVEVTNTVGDAGLEWNGFPGHLSQVIINLIQNVMRYAYKGDAGGKVDVRLSTLDRSGEKWYRVVVQDYGAGIPEKNLKHLFEPFFTTGRSTGGTGLGLAIVDNIMRNLLHGHIKCESQVGVGTTFTVDVPAAVPEPKSEASGEAAAAAH